MARTSFKPTRERKQRRNLQGQLQQNATSKNEEHDTNAEIIISSSPSTKEKRRAELHAKLAKPRMSSKKVKRLNKYIENKLRKEETNALLVKLAETKVDTSLFVSARDIGKAKETKKERVKRALAEMGAELKGSSAPEVLYIEREVRMAETWEEIVEARSVEDECEEVKEKCEVLNRNVEQCQDLPLIEREGADTRYTADQIRNSVSYEISMLQRSQEKQSSSIPSTVGKGLKRPLELDESGKPILKRIKRTEALGHLFRATAASVKLKNTKWDTQTDGDLRHGCDSIPIGTNEREEACDKVDDEEVILEEWYGFSDFEDSEEMTSLEGDEESVEDDEENTEDILNDDDDDDDDGQEPVSVPRFKKGASATACAFKIWAESARMTALGMEEHKPGNNIPIFPKLPPGVILPRRAPSSSPPPKPLPPLPPTSKAAFYIAVDRSEDIQIPRLNLPIVALEQQIMETITNNSTTVICGATGSGKTTQLPQFLYEAGYGNPLSPDTPGLIGITQPRRVAAVSMAKRVQEELGYGHEGKVGYQIRFEGTMRPETAIKFMTDGVLLRELANDFLLSKYSAIVIDEAHERGINTDILIGVMSRVVRLRHEMHQEDPAKTKALKLIIMSATLRVSDFIENKTLFSTPPPVINAEARQFAVSIHFSRRTVRDYVDEAYRKICKMHRRLPMGGILVFLTGQNEIQYLMKKLRKTFPLPKLNQEGPEEQNEPKVKILASEVVVETEDVELSTTMDSTVHQLLTEDDNETEDISFFSDNNGHESDLSGAEGVGEGSNNLSDTTASPLHILPLYSLLPTDQQLRIFQDPPPGHRLCILATNIAETSLTIPNIRYVVDTGRVKSRVYIKSTGVTSYDITWVSKASAAQRAGRAGRTGPGHCYRLYSSAVFERDFTQFTDPEILQMPIEGVVLQMKGMNIERVINFPFPTPPDKEDLKRAERVLGYLGALKSPFGSSTGDDVARRMLTDMGRVMATLPLPPRFAKILIIGQQHGCLPYVIAITAALSIGELFLPEHQLDLSLDDDSTDEAQSTKEANRPIPTNTSNLAASRAQAQRKAYHQVLRVFTQLDPTCDILRLLSAVCAFEHEYSTLGPAAAEVWCGNHFLRYKGMLETRRLRRQLTDIVKSNCPGATAALTPPPGKKHKQETNPRQRRSQPPIPTNPLLLKPPNATQIKALKQIFAAGFIDQIAIRADLLPPTTTTTTALGPLPPLRKYSKMTSVPYTPLSPPSVHSPYSYIHPSSPLAQLHATKAPKFIIYSTLTTAANPSLAEGQNARVRMLPLTPLDSGKVVTALAKGTSLLTHSKPLGGKVDVQATEDGKVRKEVWVQRMLRREGAAGELGWELGVEKVAMIKKGGGWIVDEK